MESQAILRGPAGDLKVRREAHPGDAEAIVGLHRRIYPGEHGVDESFVADVATALERAIALGWPGAREGCWVVERDGELAGCLALTDEGGGEGRVRFFLLAPELRGHGLGRRLLEELLRMARDFGYEFLTLSTFSDLRAAGHLYRDAGFEVVRADEGPRWGRDEFVYQHYRLEL